MELVGVAQQGAEVVAEGRENPLTLCNRGYVLTRLASQDSALPVASGIFRDRRTLASYSGPARFSPPPGPALAEQTGLHDVVHGVGIKLHEDLAIPRADELVGRDIPQKVSPRPRRPL